MVLSLSLSLSLLSLLCAKLFSFLFGGEDDDQNSSFFLLTVFQISPFNFTPFLCVKFRVLDKKFFLGPPLSSFLKKKIHLSLGKSERVVFWKRPPSSLTLLVGGHLNAKGALLLLSRFVTHRESKRSKRREGKKKKKHLCCFCFSPTRCRRGKRSNTNTKAITATSTRTRPPSERRFYLRTPTSSTTSITSQRNQER